MVFYKGKNQVSQRQERYSIKKFKFGAASVLVGLAFLGAGQVSVEAAETTNPPAGTVTTSDTFAEEETPIEQSDTSLNDSTGLTAQEEALDIQTDPETGVQYALLDETASTGEQVHPAESSLAISTTTRSGDPVEDGSEIVSGVVIQYQLNLKFDDKTVINNGDYIDLTLTDKVVVTPSPYAEEIKNDKGDTVAFLTLTAERDANNAYVQTKGQLVFTDAFAKQADKEVNLRFNTYPSGKWTNAEVTPMTVSVNGTDISSYHLKLYVSTSVNFGTSNRLWQLEEPYTLYHQAEVAVIDKDNDTATTVVFEIDPATQAYAKYDVAKIRNEGWTLLFGEARNSYTRYNTLTNDQGIVATVNDEGTKVTLTFPKWTANFGLNAGSIPVLLTTKAIAEQAAEETDAYYYGSMTVYSAPVGTDPLETTPLRQSKTKQAIYQFLGSSARSVDEAVVIVNYVDEKGNAVGERETITTKVGASYSTEAKTIADYRLVTKPSNASGTVTAEDVNNGVIEVNYVYTSNSNIQTGLGSTQYYVLYVENGKVVGYSNQLNGISTAFTNEELVWGENSKTILAYTDSTERVLVGPDELTYNGNTYTKTSVEGYGYNFHLPLQAAVGVSYADYISSENTSAYIFTQDYAKYLSQLSADAGTFETFSSSGLALPGTFATEGALMQVGSHQVLFYIYSLETAVPDKGETADVDELYITTWELEDGTQLAEPQIGFVDKDQSGSDLSGYDFIETIRQEGVGQKHIYRLSVTPEPTPTPQPNPRPKAVPADQTRDVKTVTESVLSRKGTRNYQPTLPETGDEESVVYSLMGLASLVGLAGLAVTKRKAD